MYFYQSIVFALLQFLFPLLSDFILCLLKLKKNKAHSHFYYYIFALYFTLCSFCHVMISCKEAGVWPAKPIWGHWALYAKELVKCRDYVETFRCIGSKLSHSWKVSSEALKWLSESWMVKKLASRHILHLFCQKNVIRDSKRAQNVKLDSNFDPNLALNRQKPTLGLTKVKLLTVSRPKKLLLC